MSLVMSQAVSPAESVEALKTKLDAIRDKEQKARVTRFIVSALSNIPWIGGFIGAGAALHAEKEQAELMIFKCFGWKNINAKLKSFRIHFSK